jgi:hypothetical protein
MAGFEVTTIGRIWVTTEGLSDAEAALVARARELFYTGGDDGEEGESLDYAICIVHALRESLSRRNSARKNVSIPPQAVAATMRKWQTA